MARQTERRRKIVASRHLAETEIWQASEFEFGLIVAYNGFSRWMSKCMAAAGAADLAPLEILVLHQVVHRDRPKRLSDICFLLNIEDTHTVNYALKKLRKAGYVVGEKSGKEIHYSPSADGVALCERYAEVREACLLEGLKHFQDGPEQLSDMGALLRVLSGIYDQAARSAVAL